MPPPKGRRTRRRAGSSVPPSHQAATRPPILNLRAPNGRRRRIAPLNGSAARRRLGVNPRADVHSGRVHRATRRSIRNMSTEESLTIIHDFLSDCERNLAESHVQRERLAQMASQVLPSSVAVPLDPGNAPVQTADSPFRRTNFGERDHVAELAAGRPGEALSHIDSTDNRLQLEEEVQSTGSNDGSVQLDPSGDNNIIVVIFEIDENQTEADVPPRPDEDNAQD